MLKVKLRNQFSLQKLLVIITLNLTLSSNAFAIFEDEAEAAFNNADFEKSEELYKKKLSSEPRSFQHLYNLGVTQYQGKKFAEALESFKKASQSNEMQLKTSALYNQSMAEIMLGDLKAAKESLTAALNLDLDNKMITENLKWVEDQLQNNKQSKSDDKQEHSDQENSDKENSDKENSDKENSAQNHSDESKNNDQTKQSDEKQNQVQKQDNQEAPSQDKVAGNRQQDLTENNAENNTTASKEQGNAGSQQSEQVILSPEEMQKQDAEKLLRSVEDQIGRYLVPNVSPEEMRRANDKSW